MEISSIIGIVVILFIIACLKIINQYELGLVFTLGKYTGTRKPGLRMVVPIIQRMERVDMRIRTIDIVKQQIMTKDNVPVHVNAALFFKVDEDNKGCFSASKRIRF